MSERKVILFQNALKRSKYFYSYTKNIPHENSWCRLQVRCYCMYVCMYALLQFRRSPTDTKQMPCRFAALIYKELIRYQLSSTLLYDTTM